MNPDKGSFTVDEVLNAVDSLETAASFLARSDAFKWKWIAIALDHALYGFSVAAVAIGEPFNVLRKPNGVDDDGHMFERQGGWRRSRRVKIDQGPAYRIEWTSCDPPSEPVEQDEPFEQGMWRLLEGDLIGFWTALARVQDPVLWMGRLSTTRALHLTDDQMRGLVRLHEDVRNELVHFVPKTNVIRIRGIQDASKDIINAIGFLVFQSFAVHSFKEDVRDRVQTAMMRFADYYEAQPEVAVPSSRADAGRGPVNLVVRWIR